MTREELLEEIDKERKWLDEAGYTAYNIDIVFSSIYKNIKALEPKTDVLDKIRAEIIDMRSKQNCSCADCLDIIDKYRK